MDVDKFYDDAKTYWNGIPATVNGMLGGCAHVSSTDIKGSRQFIRHFIDNGTNNCKALDCGAGIGRITKRLLLPLFDTVDMVELNQDFIDKAKTLLANYAPRMGRYICSGLQDFTPDIGYYDVIWCQWVLGQLTDEHLMTFLRRCKSALTHNGVIVVKENIAKSDTPIFDDEDSSYTRPQHNLVDIIHKSGLKILKEDIQKNFPSELFEVRMFALQ